MYRLTEDEPVHVERWVTLFRNGGIVSLNKSCYLLCPSDIYKKLLRLGINIKSEHIEKFASLAFESEEGNPKTHIRIIYDFLVPLESPKL